MFAEALACEGGGFFHALSGTVIRSQMGRKMLLHFLHFLQYCKSIN